MVAPSDSGLSYSGLLDRAAALSGVAVVAIDRDLRVTDDAGPLEAARFRPTSQVGMLLAEAFGVEASDELEQGCRRAFAGSEVELRCNSRARSQSYVVRLAPPTDEDDRVVALWVAVSDPADGLDRERARGDELHLLWLASRSLARAEGSDEIRETVCNATGMVAGSRTVALLERSGDGTTLEITASKGCPDDLPTIPADDPTGPGLAFRSGGQLITAPGDPVAPAVAELRDATELASIIWQPICRGRAVDAVLMVGYRRDDPIPSEREARLIETISVETSIALERERRRQRSIEEANSDPLTGLSNRRVLDSELPREMARAARREESLCLAVIDLDHFKAYNDAYGHAQGDDLLAGLAERWLDCQRGSDLLVRQGGDEFVVVLPECGTDEARQILERMLIAGDYTFCAGVALSDGAEAPEALLQRADEALYRAKRQGPGSIAV